MPRHWQEVMDVTNTHFPFDLDTFTLAHIIDSPILQHKDDVEEVTTVNDCVGIPGVQKTSSGLPIYSHNSYPLVQLTATPDYLS